MHVADFDYELPTELIAQTPPAERGASRLLAVDRRSGRFDDHLFSDLPALLGPGDLLVLNDTRVVPARLLGHRLPGGGAAECLLIRRLPDDEGPTREPGVGEGAEVWEALVHPGQRLKAGSRMVFAREGRMIHAEVLDRRYHGRRAVRLWAGEADLASAVDVVGHMPLPPYIKRMDHGEDRERYQTVYARARGAIAAPTAGLHFTRGLLEALDTRGVERTTITLHVGYGTFQPIRTDTVEAHTMAAEAFDVSPVAAAALSRALESGRRIIAVGTTTTRTLESLRVSPGGRVEPTSGWTDLFIAPGHEFRIVSGLITNFHLPKSSLLMLVAAFATRDIVLAAYRHAVSERYRFYSYGDAMVLL